MSVGIHLSVIGAAFVLISNPPEFAVKAGRDTVSLSLVAEAVVSTPTPPSPTLPAEPHENPAPPVEGTVAVIAEAPSLPTPPAEQTPSEPSISIQPTQPQNPDPAVPVHHTSKSGKDAVSAKSEAGGKPDYLSNPLPVYPESCRRQKQEGVVLLKVTISPDGHTDDVFVENSSGFSPMDQAAIAAVQKWRFRPASIGTIKIRSVVIIPVNFRLDN